MMKNQTTERRLIWMHGIINHEIKRYLQLILTHGIIQLLKLLNRDANEDRPKYDKNSFISSHVQKRRRC